MSKKIEMYKVRISGRSALEDLFGVDRIGFIRKEDEPDRDCEFLVFPTPRKCIDYHPIGGVFIHMSQIDAILQDIEVEDIYNQRGSACV